MAKSRWAFWTALAVAVAGPVSLATPASSQELEGFPAFEVAMTAEPAANADTIFTCCDHGFTPNGTVTIEVFDSPGGPSLFGPADISTDQDGYFWVGPDEHGLDLEPGMHVVVGDAELAIMKELTLADIGFRRLSPGNDTAVGTAPAGSSLWVWVGYSALDVGAYLQPTADEAGVWTADFSSVFDVQARMGGNVHLEDGDGDTTRAGIPARPGSQHQPRMQGR